MGQVIHIFRKDVRHFWREILVSLGILATFAWLEPRKWWPYRYSQDIASELFARWLPGLLVISWFLLILRLVQDESLVGDRQFWVTRPYDWKRLLAAKALFTIAFINVPLFVAQIFLLARAGYSPSHYLVDLGWIQLAWLLVVILPMVALSTITSSLGQTILTALGILIFFGSSAALASQLRIPKLEAVRRLPDYSGSTVLIATLFAVVVWQYACRATVKSRLLLAVVGISLLAIAAISPPERFPAEMYSEASREESLPAKFAFDAEGSATGVGFQSGKDTVALQIPLRVEGTAPNTLVQIDGTLARIEAKDGTTWSGEWTGARQDLTSNQKSTTVMLQMDKKFFERVKSTDVKVHLWLALTDYVAKDVQRITLAENEFSLPGKALCAVYSNSADSLLCRSPLGRPFLFASATLRDSACHGTSKQEIPETTYYGWNWPWQVAWLRPVLSPVNEFSLQFLNGDRMPDVPVRVACPGTRISVGTLQDGKRLRTELTIDSLQLGNYQLPERQGQTATGISLW